MNSDYFGNKYESNPVTYRFCSIGFCRPYNIELVTYLIINIFGHPVLGVMSIRSITPTKSVDNRFLQNFTFLRDTAFLLAPPKVTVCVRAHLRVTSVWLIIHFRVALTVFSPRPLPVHLPPPQISPGFRHVPKMLRNDYLFSFDDCVLGRRRVKVGPHEKVLTVLANLSRRLLSNIDVCIESRFRFVLYLSWRRRWYILNERPK